MHRSATPSAAPASADAPAGPSPWRSNRRALALTYALTILENVCDTLYPALTGFAVDGLLASRPWRLGPLLGLWLLHLGIGLGRHLYDTSTFTRIHGALAASMVTRQRAAGVAASQIVARVALSREVVAFLETDLPTLARALFRIAGALLLLAFYDRILGLLALAALLPATAINHWFARVSRRLNAALNDRLEREAGIVAERPAALLRRHFARVRFWRMRISRAEAAAWGGVELAAIALTLAVLLRMTAMRHVTAGEIYAVLAYVWNFYDGIGEVPGLVQHYARARDIAARLATRDPPPVT